MLLESIFKPSFLSFSDHHILFYGEATASDFLSSHKKGWQLREGIRFSAKHTIRGVALT